MSHMHHICDTEYISQAAAAAVAATAAERTKNIVLSRRGLDVIKKITQRWSARARAYVYMFCAGRQGNRQAGRQASKRAGRYLCAWSCCAAPCSSHKACMCVVCIIYGMRVLCVVTRRQPQRPRRLNDARAVLCVVGFLWPTSAYKKVYYMSIRTYTHAQYTYLLY